MILRICVAVYAHDDSRTVSEVVNSVLKHSPFPVLVLDDGSETPVANVLYSWDVRSALEQNRVRVERYERHQGKGKALQMTVQRLVAEGFTHMLTLDGNGHHLPSEIGKLVAVGKKQPWDLVLGRRHQPAAVETVERKTWKAKLAGFWIRYQTGSLMVDPRSGFRLYPLLAMQTLSFFSRRQEFEIEALIRLQWDGVSVHEIEVEHHPTIEAKYLAAKRQYLDGLRVSALNAVLALVSLFKTHRSPKELSTALGLGVFVGCTPFFGFHTLMIMALAVILRLNMVVMWIGTHVSTPLLAPLVIMIEIWIGRHWLHIALELGRRGEFYQWLAGSVVLGVGLGAVTMLLAYYAAWSVQNRRREEPWGDRIPGGRAGAVLLRLLARYANADVGTALLWVGVPYFYCFALSARRGLSEYYKILEPHATWRRRQKLILRHLHSFAVTWLERTHQQIFPRAVTQSPLGRDGLMLTAHVGALELAVGNVPTVAIDRIVSPNLELLPFFGKLVAIDVDGFFKAARAQTSVVAAFGANGKLQAGAVRTLRFAGDEANEIQCLKWAADFIDEWEDVVRSHPDQWFNFFPIWSAVPRGEPVETDLLEDLRGLNVLQPLPSSPDVSSGEV